MAPHPQFADAPLPPADFREPQGAAANLRRIAAVAPAAVVSALGNLLPDLPDPDAALNLFERLCAGASPGLLRVFARQPLLVHYAVAVCGFSHYLGDTLIQNQGLLPQFERERQLEHSCSVDDYREALAHVRGRAREHDVPLALAHFKRREYVRIMLRDVLGIATLGEVTAEISALADVLIAEALRDARATLRHRFGVPRVRDARGRLVEPRFAVLGLGKLGGNELNYNSDVDLFFLYRDGEADESSGSAAAISNREFCIRLAQLVTETLSRTTREGPVFRIDLRLRPAGGEGEPAVGLQHALHYYAQVAHDWEQQAMIKARYVAGDAALAHEFLAGVAPFVYQQELNFAAIETALASRERMGVRRRQRPLRRRGIDVKLDRGGIRDIEFLAQCLQRVYGGNEPWLRAAGTLLALQKLHDKGHLAGKDFHELSIAYEFLRRVEHRLQLRRGQQTHRLPEARAELRILGRSLLSGSPQQEPVADVVATVKTRMAAVAEIYARIVYHQQAQRPDEFHLELSAPALGGEHSLRQALQRLAADSPESAASIAHAELTAAGRRNLHRYLSAALTSPERYAAVFRKPRALERALLLFETSEFLTDLLVRHPEEVALLEAGGGVARAPRLFEVGEGEAFPPGTTYAGKLTLLRQRHRHATFISAAADVTASRCVYESLQETAAAADAAVAGAVVAADAPPGFVVLALGRLGTCEFDLGSDADLLFLRDERTNPPAATRAAERAVEVLSAYTRDGAVFSVDTRLRPRGMEGELVITPAQLDAYFATEAQPWEALSYTKLRHVGGAADVGAAAIAAVRRRLARFAADPGFAAAAREMRVRLEKSEPPADLKLGPGGFYDVDFAASYLMVRHMPERRRGNTRALLQELAAGGWLQGSERALLDRAGELLRTTDHVIRLVLGRARRTLPPAERPRQVVEQLVAAILRREFEDGLEAELAASRVQVRAAYDRLVQ